MRRVSSRVFVATSRRAHLSRDSARAMRRICNASDMFLFRDGIFSFRGVCACDARRRREKRASAPRALELSTAMSKNSYRRTFDELVRKRRGSPNRRNRSEFLHICVKLQRARVSKSAEGDTRSGKVIFCSPCNEREREGE